MITDHDEASGRERGIHGDRCHIHRYETMNAHERADVREPSRFARLNTNPRKLSTLTRVDCPSVAEVSGQSPRAGLAG